MKKFVKNLEVTNMVTGEKELITGMFASMDDPSVTGYSEIGEKLFSESNDEEMTDEELNEYTKREEDWMNETYELNKDYFEDENAQRERWMKLVNGETNDYE